MITHLYEALEKSKQYLGNHELTLNCYKRLGDIKMQKRDNEDALGFYDKAEEIRKVLEITESSVSSVYLLKNRGSCPSYLGRHKEAVQVLKKARGIVENLPGNNTQCKFEVYYRLAEARHEKEPGCPEAIEDATKALRLINKVHGKDISCKKRKLEEIIACMKS